MPGELTPAQEANVAADVTRAVVFMVLNHSGVEELLSATGDLVYDGQPYEGGGVQIVSISDSQSATFTLPATPERVSQVEKGDWRHGSCRIYTIPAMPGDDAIYEADEAFLLIDGEIQLSAFRGGKVTVNVTHHNNANRISPSHTWDEVCHHIPAAGSILSWEGKELILSAQVSPGSNDYVSNSARAVGGRLTAAQLKKLSAGSSTYTITTTAAGAPMAIVYGQRPVPGKIFAIGSISGDLVVGVGWCLGEIGGYEATYISDAVLPAGVTATHYTGRFNQRVDPTLAAAIVAYNDDLVLRTPRGSVGAAYSVYRIPTGELSTAPTFKAVLNGMAVHDPRVVGENDPQYTNTAFAICFDSAVDVSPNEFAYSLYSSVSINDVTGYLECTSGALRVAHDAAFEIGASTQFDINVRFVVDAVSGAYEAIAASGSNAGNTNRGWVITLDNTNKLRFRASSNGTSWDICDVTLSATAATAGREYVVSARRKSSTAWEILLNGVVVSTFSSSAAIYNGSAGLSVGAQSDGTHVANPFTGRVKYFRLTVGGYRIPLGLSPISALPFPEYKQYSDNSALCAADHAVNSVYGLGSAVIGLEAAADFDDELIDGGNERARISIALTDPRRASENVDLLLDYAECIRYNDGASIVLVPDRMISADNPSGQEVTKNSSFEVDVDWSKQAGWTIGGGVASCDGSQVVSAGISQTVPTDDGAKYAIRAEIACSAGSWTLKFGGADVDSGSADKVSKLCVAAVGTSRLIRFLGDEDFVGTVSLLSVTRLYWKETRYIKGTLSIDPTPDDDIPTLIKGRYTVPVVSDPNWPEAITDAVKLSGVDSGEVESIETMLTLPGVYREVEALNKINTRLQRGINPVQYSWQTTDHALRFRKADVIEAIFDQVGVNATVWLKNVRWISPGRYQVTGTRYSEGHYPIELPSTSAGTIPVGGITLLEGTSVPAGWDLYTAADGRAIVIAGGEYAVGDTGGADTHDGFSGTVSESDGHDGSYVNMKITQAVYSPSGSGYVFSQGAGSAAVHDHTYDTGVIEPDPYVRENVLIQKVGSTSSTFPAGTMNFGLAGINTLNRSRITAYAGRLLKAAAASANAGSATKSVSFTTSSDSFAHTHWNSVLTNQRQVDLDVVDTVHSEVSGGTTHPHSFNLTLNRDIKRARVALYGGTGSRPLAPGDFLLWGGSLESLPADWVLCDGENGTDDLTDHFLEIASGSNEGTTTGDNTISIAGSGNKVYHDHSAGTSAAGETKTTVNHSNSMAHTHSVDESDTWKPPYYALAMIMYAP